MRRGVRAVACRRSGVRRRGGVLPAALAVSLLVVLAPTGFAGEQEKEGKFLYEIYCSNCHGEKGGGDGPTAEVLTVKPPDLTQISKRHGGKFPGDEIRRIIDGRDVERAHGRSQMPLWGLAFQQLETDTVQEDEVRTKIDQLVAYLKTIQKDPE
jgi:mono/diheme cytochrome c family protein